MYTVRNTNNNTIRREIQEKSLDYYAFNNFFAFILQSRHTDNSLRPTFRNSHPFRFFFFLHFNRTIDFFRAHHQNYRLMPRKANVC